MPAALGAGVEQGAEGAWVLQKEGPCGEAGLQICGPDRDAGQRGCPAGGASFLHTCSLCTCSFPHRVQSMDGLTPGFTRGMRVALTPGWCERWHAWAVDILATMACTSTSACTCTVPPSQTSRSDCSGVGARFVWTLMAGALTGSMRISRAEH